MSLLGTAVTGKGTFSGPLRAMSVEEYERLLKKMHMFVRWAAFHMDFTGWLEVIQRRHYLNWLV